ncbi:Gag-Pol polyprotein, partial [Mucuna pruriens]
MGPFPVSNGYSYILLVIDYISRWVEAIATKTNDAKVVVDFLKSISSVALTSDQGSHFCNRAMSALLHKYGVVHRIATAYHPQTNGQAEVFNREIKKTQQKMANPSRKDWSRLLKDALWAHITTYQTPIGMSPYQIVVKQCNLAYDQASKQRKIQLQELDELFLEAYENFHIYKQKIKQFHDQQILRKEFQVDQKVLVFKSVNEYQIKLFHEGPIPTASLYWNQPRWMTHPEQASRSLCISTLYQLQFVVYSWSRSSVGKTPGDTTRVVYLKRVEKEKKERQLQDEAKKMETAKIWKLQQKCNTKLQNKKVRKRRKEKIQGERKEVSKGVLKWNRSVLRDTLHAYKLIPYCSFPPYGVDGEACQDLTVSVTWDVAYLPWMWKKPSKGCLSPSEESRSRKSRPGQTDSLSSLPTLQPSSLKELASIFILQSILSLSLHWRCTVLQRRLSRLRRCRSRTGKPKIVRGDQLVSQCTLMDLILSVLIIDGEPSLPFNGDCCGRLCYERGPVPEPVCIKSEECVVNPWKETYSRLRPQARFVPSRLIADSNLSPTLGRSLLPNFVLTPMLAPIRIRLCATLFIQFCPGLCANSNPCLAPCHLSYSVLSRHLCRFQFESVPHLAVPSPIRLHIVSLFNNGFVPLPQILFYPHAISKDGSGSFGNLCDIPWKKKNPRVLTPLPVSCVKLLPHLLRCALVTIVPLKPIQSPYPKSYDPRARCEYHGGLKHKVQDLIDARLLVLLTNQPEIYTSKSLNAEDEEETKLIVASSLHLPTL